MKNFLEIEYFNYEIIKIEIQSIIEWTSNDVRILEF